MRKPGRPMVEELPPLQAHVTRVTLNYAKKRLTWSRDDRDIHLQYDHRLKPLRVIRMLEAKGYTEVYTSKNYRAWEREEQ